MKTKKDEKTITDEWENSKNTPKSIVLEPAGLKKTPTDMFESLFQGFYQCLAHEDIFFKMLKKKEKKFPPQKISSLFWGSQMNPSIPGNILRISFLWGSL